jgi:7-cyano-7-deazaguanine reductase
MKWLAKQVKKMKHELDNVTLSPLGKETRYVAEYQKELLFPIARKLKRDEIQVPDRLPFKGVDIWNAYEISWLNEKGKPVVALGEFILPCYSPNIIESKSLKLYLNSFNNTRFASSEQVRQRIQHDLSECAGASVCVSLILLDESSSQIISSFAGICLDQLDIECDHFVVEPHFLTTESETVSEIVYSDLLKSNCLVTNQPDWGSVQIQYSGKKIQHAGLLKYIVSFRNHNEFHEQCVERIFMDIMQICQPEKLTVHACYTRRGGLDINPYRSTEKEMPDKIARQWRQ